MTTGMKLGTDASSITPPPPWDSSSVLPAGNRHGDQAQVRPLLTRKWTAVALVRSPKSDKRLP